MSHLEPSPSRRRPPSAPLLAATAVLVLLLAGACTAPIATPSPAPTTAPSPSAVPSPTSVRSAEEAAAAVLASDPRFAGLQPQDPNAIGQCCTWTAAPAADGYDVTIEIGWGDCPAGCIDRHRWFYSVAPNGTVTLDREEGPPVPAGIPGPADGTGIVGIRGVATAGPVCPVVRPNDPNCADRPVAGATVHILDATGLEVATLTTDGAGSFVVALPAGRYRVQADPVAGLMGAAPAADVDVAGTLALVQLGYDTGIR
jgi:hypothetical protein